MMEHFYFRPVCFLFYYIKLTVSYLTILPCKYTDTNLWKFSNSKLLDKATLQVYNIFIIIY